MISLANNSLSCDISDKRLVGDVFAPKYKTRKVCAKRKFPPRCGHNASTAILDQEEDDGVGVEQATAFRNSEAATSRANGAGIPVRSVEFVALCNSETTNEIEGDGVKTGGVSNPSIPCVKSSNMGVFPSFEAVTYNADGPTNDFVELMTETKPITVDKLDKMKSDSSNQDTMVGSQTSPKDGKNVVEELKSRLRTDDSVDKEVILQNNLLPPSVCCSMQVRSTRLRDKYSRRRVSANRIFPPYCGRNSSLPVEQEKLIAISGSDCPDLPAKVEVEAESEVKCHMLPSEEVFFDGFDMVHVKNETPKALCDYSRKGALREMEATMGNELVYVDREVVHCLMAKAFCPWRNEKRVAESNGKSSGDKGREQFCGLDAKAVVRKCSLQSVSPRAPSKKQKQDRHSADAHSRASKKHKKGRHSNDAHSSAGALTLSDDVGPSHDDEIPKYSAAPRCQPKQFEVNLPPFGPSSSGDGDARNRVRESLRLFQAVCRKLLHEEESNLMPKDEKKSKQSGKKHRRIDLDATKMIKEMGKGVNVDKQILGEIPGVEVGDEFQYRVELTFVGIHRLYQGGIDWMKHNGVPVATSIVSAGVYANDFEKSDVLIYCGQGGNVVEKSKAPEDQKLEKGNLALRNSISAKTPVRVIRGWKEPKASSHPLDTKPKLMSTYVYDGLYTVVNYWTETGPHGKQVFMFELRRNPGQPELAWKQLKQTNKSKFRPGVCVQDISVGREHFPISAVNIFGSETPPPFKYISKLKYPDWFQPIPLTGCDCTGKCSDSKRCKCAVRNGGEIPYNRSGALVEIKPLVYECGPHCRCPPSCYNRVGQSGIKFQLEIFKTEFRGWGVRALNSIPSGSFICEYVGELLEDREAEQRVGNDEYLFDIGRNHHDSSLKPEEEAAFIDPKVEGGGYTIDAAEYGNVGRFINHCCLPNLYAQNVIYDHDDTRMPHIMLFAMENIPPLQELTYDYNYSMGQIRDTDGKIKVKKCYCGAAQCTGRLY